eukprot:6173552-Pyramimonas_sp.AAC.1
MEGEAFRDGSGLKTRPAVYDAPAWSLVRIDETGKLVASVSGPWGPASLPRRPLPGTWES